MNKPRRGILAALVLAAALALGATPAAFADDPVTELSSTVISGDATSLQLTFTQRLELAAEGLPTPDETFSYSITPVGNAPGATVGTTVFSSNDIPIRNNGAGENTLMGHVEKTGTISFNSFTHAGEFIYVLKPMGGSTDGMTYSRDTFTIRVYIQNNGDGLKVSAITAANAAGGSADKQAQIVFASQYAKTTSITISKTVAGDYGDKTESFEFNVALLSVPDTTANVSGQIKDASGNDVGNPISILLEINPIEPKWTTFNLKHGEKLVITDVPVGSHWRAYEDGDQNNGYTATAVTLINGVEYAAGNNDVNDPGAAVTSYGGEGFYTLAGVGENAFNVTNTFTTDVPITGVIAHNAPFITLLGLGAAALVALVVVKRRRAQRLG